VTETKPACFRARYFFLCALLVASCNPIRGCAESEFHLRPDSRLPKWFSLPAGRSRDEVNVTLSYYTTQGGIDDAIMELVDHNGRSLASASGQMCWHPAMRDKTNDHGGFDVNLYPFYVIITVHGITEVIEHRMEPFFGVTDDPALAVQANESISKRECRKGASEFRRSANR
jgi:hypothetical protein